MYFLISRIVRHMTEMSIHSFERVDLQNIGRLGKGFPEPWKKRIRKLVGSCRLQLNAHLVFIIFRKALIDFNRVTI